MRSSENSEDYVSVRGREIRSWKDLKEAMEIVKNINIRYDLDNRNLEAIRLIEKRLERDYGSDCWISKQACATEEFDILKREELDRRIGAKKRKEMKKYERFVNYWSDTFYRKTFNLIYGKRKLKGKYKDILFSDSLEKDK